MEKIKFGTDGWRAKIAEGFTFENLAKITDAYAAQTLTKIQFPRIVIGYDFRFMSEKYAAFTAERLKNYGFAVFLFDKAVPTPLVSWAVVERELDSGLMITSSHNPYTYNGFKIKNSHGAGATPEETTKVEALLGKKLKLKAEGGKITLINMDEAYINKVKTIVDTEAIKRSGMKIVMDVMYGSGAGYMENILDRYKNLKLIHSTRDPLFGGITPEPIRPNLLGLEEAVKREKADIGIAIDGDGDRMAFVDDRGNFMPTHKALVFLMLHHIKYKKMKFRFVKTISGTSLLNMIAAEYGIKLHETPVGFKYIGDYMIKDPATIGGEESGGIGFGYYMPERDGIVSNLLMLEFLAKEGKKVSQVIAGLDKKYGPYMYDRVDVKFHEKDRKKIIARVKRLEKGKFIAGKRILEANKLDGIKYVLADNEWILFRFSGTEPLLRIYSEAPTMEKVRENLNFGQEIVK